jgi:hypothetical protein
MHLVVWCSISLQVHACIQASTYAAESLAFVNHLLKFSVFDQSCLPLLQHTYVLHNRQHHETADVEKSRLASQLEAARAAAAAASGQAGQVEAAANAKLEAALQKQVQVCIGTVAVCGQAHCVLSSNWC